MAKSGLGFRIWWNELPVLLINYNILQAALADSTIFLSRLLRFRQIHLNRHVSLCMLP